MEPTGRETTWTCGADALAVFALDTGLCLEGPCPSARLERVAVARRGHAPMVGP